MSTVQYSRSTLESGGAPLWPDARDHADRKIDRTQDFKRLRNWLEKGVARAWPAIRDNLISPKRTRHGCRADLEQEELFSKAI